MNEGRNVSGGGEFVPLRVEAIPIVDAFSIADAFGFDKLHFLRVIRPADNLYREAVANRIANGHR